MSCYVKLFCYAGVLSALMAGCQPQSAGTQNPQTDSVPLFLEFKQAAVPFSEKNVAYEFQKIPDNAYFDGVVQGIHLAFKTSPDEIYVSQFEGNTWKISPTEKKVVDYIQSAVAVDSSKEKLIALPKDEFWIVRQNSVMRSAPVQTALGSPQAQALEVSLGGSVTDTQKTMPLPLGLGSQYLITYREKKVQITSYFEGKLSVFETSWPGEFTAPVGAGAIQDSQSFWFASPPHVLVLDAQQLVDGTSRYFWRSADLQLKGIEGAPRGLGLYMKKGNTLETVGGAVAVSGGEILLSDTGTGEVRGIPAWSADVFPVAHNHCARCHWSGARSRWTGAELRLGWVTAPYLEKLKGLFSGKVKHRAMTAFSWDSLPVTDVQKVGRWLNEGRDVTTAEGATPGGTGVAPAFDAEVKPVLQSRCVACHSTYADGAVVNTLRSKFLTRVQGGTMPPPWSQQAQQLTAPEKDTLLRYLMTQP